MKYKFIYIEQENQETKSDHPVYTVRNVRTDAPLASIYWYQTWRQFVFTPERFAFFNNSCLRDILDFMENHTQK